MSTGQRSGRVSKRRAAAGRETVDELLTHAHEWIDWLEEHPNTLSSLAARKSLERLRDALHGVHPAARELLMGLTTLPQDWPPRRDPVETLEWAANSLLENLKTNHRPAYHEAYRYAVGFLVHAWRAKDGRERKDGRGRSPVRGQAAAEFKKFAKKHGVSDPNVRPWLTKRPPTMSEFKAAGYQWPPAPKRPPPPPRKPPLLLD